MLKEQLWSLRHSRWILIHYLPSNGNYFWIKMISWIIRPYLIPELCRGTTAVISWKGFSNIENVISWWRHRTRATFCRCQISEKKNSVTSWSLIHLQPTREWWLEIRKYNIVLLLCISTSEQVLCMPFAGQNHFLTLKQLFPPIFMIKC